MESYNIQYNLFYKSDNAAKNDALLSLKKPTSMTGTTAITFVHLIALSLHSNVLPRSLRKQLYHIISGYFTTSATLSKG